MAVTFLLPVKLWPACFYLAQYIAFAEALFKKRSLLALPFYWKIQLPEQGT